MSFSMRACNSRIVASRAASVACASSAAALLFRQFLFEDARRRFAFAALQLGLEFGDLVFALDQTALQRFVARLEFLEVGGELGIGSGRGCRVALFAIDQFRIDLEPDRAVFDDLQFGTGEADFPIAFDDLGVFRALTPTPPG